MLGRECMNRSHTESRPCVCCAARPSPTAHNLQNHTDSCMLSHAYDSCITPTNSVARKLCQILFILEFFCERWSDKRGAPKMLLRDVQLLILASAAAAQATDPCECTPPTNCTSGGVAPPDESWCGCAAHCTAAPTASWSEGQPALPPRSGSVQLPSRNVLGRLCHHRRPSHPLYHRGAFVKTMLRSHLQHLHWCHQSCHRLFHHCHHHHRLRLILQSRSQLSFACCCRLQQLRAGRTTKLWRPSSLP